jgi:hypothetical protein
MSSFLISFVLLHTPRDFAAFVNRPPQSVEDSKLPLADAVVIPLTD